MAAELSVSECRLRLALLNKIIGEAKEEGDERWVNLLPQIERLNEKLVEAKARERGTVVGQLAAAGFSTQEARAIVASAERGTDVVVGVKPLRLASRMTGTQR